MREQLYKVLAADRTSCYGGDATWTPGEWMPAVEGDGMLVEALAGWLAALDSRLEVA